MQFRYFRSHGNTGIVDRPLDETVKRTLPALLLSVILAFAGASPAAEAETDLVLENGAGRVLFSRPVRLGDRFSIVFTHSLALSRVEEVYEVTGRDEFRLRETIYEDFGAGLPHEEAPGQRMEFANGRIRLGGYTMRFEELHLRVGHIADHRLEIDGIVVLHFNQVERPGGGIRLCVTRGPPTSDGSP